MKKYSSIKAVRPIVIVAIFVLLTILFALYSTSINPIAEDVFTALDLDDTPLADVATDVKQAEAVTLSDSQTTGGGVSGYSMASFEEKRNQSSLGSTISESGYNFGKTDESISSGIYDFAIGYNYQKGRDDDGETFTGSINDICKTPPLGGTNANKNQTVAVMRNYALSTKMYNAILSGAYTVKMYVNVGISEANNGTNADLEFWPYIGIGHQTDSSLNGYNEYWGAVGSSGKTAKVKRKGTTSADSPYVSLPTPTDSPNKSTNADATKVLRVGFYGHVY
ncbi:MAG: hypothetical protein J6R35_00980 [Clostridia bacterium]|nr:hypothetical protein [Clostridia bacterium]